MEPDLNCTMRLL